MSDFQSSRIDEWRGHFMVPIAGALGYSMSVIHIYGINPYLVPVTTEFGWTRTQFTGAFTFAIFVQAIFSVPIGMLVDRFGPRMLGLLGVPALGGAFALLSSASGSQGNWVMLWGLIAAVALAVQATVWTSAVASRFEASRGLALAVTLCGASLAQFVFPPLATKLIADHGWRTALLMQGLGWILLCLPVIFFFFKGARDAKILASEAPKELSGTGFLEGLRSSIYLRLLLASLLFTFTIVALVFHFMPLLTGRGIEPSKAAWVASLIGLASIAGRLGTGLLIDRFRASLVGASVFLLPVMAALLLLFGGKSDWTMIVAAAIFVGLTLGAEIDVVVYLTSQYFGLKNFGALYGGLLAALSIGTATGPLVAARIFDQTGDYAGFLWLCIALLLASSLALATLPHNKGEGVPT